MNPNKNAGELIQCGAAGEERLAGEPPDTGQQRGKNRRLGCNLARSANERHHGAEEVVGLPKRGGRLRPGDSAAAESAAGGPVTAGPGASAAGRNAGRRPPGSRRTQFPVATASARRRRVCRRAGAARPQGRRVGPAVPSSAPSLRWAVPQRHGLLFGRRLEGAAASGGADASPARRPVAASGAREDSRPPRTCLPAAAGRPRPQRDGQLSKKAQTTEGCKPFHVLKAC